jgi:hypothetical protein
MAPVVIGQSATGFTATAHGLATAGTAAASVSVSVWVPVIAAGAAALIAAVAAVWGARLQRKSGQEAAAAARASAAAANKSSEASTRSAKAAEDSVELNRVIANETGDRADAAALARRYQDAASQLGHDKAAVRLAGVYAMSRLADDWDDERQTCIDVLCAYMRLPWQEYQDSSVARDEGQVRRTITSVINRHVAEGGKVSWSENYFDFTQAQLRDFVLEGCLFTGRVMFAGAEFAGECRFDDIVFKGGASFAACVIIGRVSLNDMRAGGWQELTFAGARIVPGAELEITTNTQDPEDSGREFDFRGMEVRGKLHVRHKSSLFRQPPLDLDDMNLEGGYVDITTHRVSLSKDSRPRYPHKVKARYWKIAPHSRISIPQKFIDDGTVEWLRGRHLPGIPDDVDISFTVPPESDLYLTSAKLQSLKGQSRRRPADEGLSRGTQHDHEEKSSYARDFLS